MQASSGHLESIRAADVPVFMIAPIHKHVLRECDFGRQKGEQYFSTTGTAVYQVTVEDEHSLGAWEPNLRPTHSHTRSALTLPAAVHSLEPGCTYFVLPSNSNCTALLCNCTVLNTVLPSNCNRTVLPCNCWFAPFQRSSSNRLFVHVGHPPQPPAYAPAHSSTTALHSSSQQHNSTAHISTAHISTAQQLTAALLTSALHTNCSRATHRSVSGGGTSTTFCSS